MDYTMLDLTDVAHHEIPRLGEAVVIFGQQQGAFLTASEISQQLATIPYEIFVGVSHRVPREWRQ
jgi:alanine racemase